MANFWRGHTSPDKVLEKSKSEWVKCLTPKQQEHNAVKRLHQGLVMAHYIQTHRTNDSNDVCPFDKPLFCLLLV